jgi:hypothetical protein
VQTQRSPMSFAEALKALHACVTPRPTASQLLASKSLDFPVDSFRVSVVHQLPPLDEILPERDTSRKVAQLTQTTATKAPRWTGQGPATLFPKSIADACHPSRGVVSDSRADSLPLSQSTACSSSSSPASHALVSDSLLESPTEAGRKVLLARLITDEAIRSRFEAYTPTADPDSGASEAPLAHQSSIVTPRLSAARPSTLRSAPPPPSASKPAVPASPFSSRGESNSDTPPRARAVAPRSLRGAVRAESDRFRPEDEPAFLRTATDAQFWKHAESRGPSADLLRNAKPSRAHQARTVTSVRVEFPAIFKKK